jgi:hypothetical protein
MLTHGQKIKPRAGAKQAGGQYGKGPAPTIGMATGTGPRIETSL